MAKATLEEIAEESKSWNFINNLPDTISGFEKQIKIDINGNILTLCSYVNRAKRAKIELIYSNETQDYILTQHMGLNSYRDIRFIYREKDIFAKKVEESLPKIIELMEEPQKRNLGEMVEELGILDWEYGNNLPEKIGNFIRYIRPKDAVEHLNGSIIFLDYSDFEKKDQVVFYYNRLRDQFFAEMKIAGVFYNTKDYDCANLNALEEKIKKHLETTIEYVSAQDHNI